MKLRLLFSIAFFVVLVSCLAPAASGQAALSYAQLNGSVKDESGRAIPKAVLTLRDVDTNLRSSASANDAGFYLVPNLPPGQYELTVESAGMGRYVQTGITLSVGQTATIDVTLRVAAVSATVEVTAQAPAVEPTRSEVSQVIQAEQIVELPTIRRNFVDYALLTPGVATGRTSIQSTFTETETTRISFGGMRDLSNALTVDGADFINMATGSQRATPSQEAVSEFRVVNNSYGAEYGRALGGIVNVVTKSGANQLHGSVYGYHNNAWANARTLLTLPQFNAFRRTQFGGTLGGPLKKDKTFFFANYEGQRFAQSPTYPITLINNLTLINQSKAAMNLPPEILGGLKTLDHDNGFIRLDHQVNSNNRLGIRYLIADERDLNVLVGDTLDGGGIGAPSSGHDTFLRDQSVAGTLNSVLKPNLVNTALLQYARRHYNFPAVSGQPNLDIPNTLLFGHNFGTFDATDESRVQVSDSMSWVKGNHYLKFGGDFNHVWDYVIWPGFTPMRIVLPGFNCMVALANFVKPSANVATVPQDGPCPLPPFLNGVPIVFWGSPVGTGAIVQGSLPPAIPLGTDANGVNQWPNAYVNPQDYYVHLNHSYVGFFAQDEWRITPRLTLNYGLRWDFEAGLWRIINHDYRGWQPRVGIAYSLTNRTVVRAGYGIFDDRYNTTFFFVSYPQRAVTIPGAPQPFVRTDNGNIGNANVATYVLNLLPYQPVAAGLQYPGSTAYSTPDCPNTSGTQPPEPWCAAKELLLTGQNPPNFSTGPGPTATTPPTLVTNSGGGWNRNSRIPYSEQASFQIDQQVGQNLVISAEYLFVASHKQVRPMNLNTCPPGGVAPGAQPPFSWASPGSTACAPGTPLSDGKDGFSGPLFANAGLMYYLDDSGISVYHGGSLSVTDRIGSYLRFNANYTYSHVLDDGTFTTFVSTPQDEYNRKAEKANSVQDVRHRFIGNFTADGPQKSFLRNFELSGIVTLQTPRPFTIFAGYDANGDTNPVTDRVGLAPRNAYRGDDLYDVDLRVSRLIHVREHVGLLMAFDAFNVLNRPNVDEVTSVYGGGTIDFCGTAPSRYKDAVSLAVQQVSVTCPAGNGGAPFPNPLFGTPRTMFNARQLQISAKLSF